MTTKYAIVVLLGLISLAECQIIPSWNPFNAVIVFEEDTSLGTFLLNISARGANIDISTSGEETKKLVNITKTVADGTGNYGVTVTLASELDRDYNPSKRTLLFLASSPGVEAVTARVSLEILDVNDNPPYFQDLPYICSPPENEAVGKVIFSGISTIDPDISESSYSYFTWAVDSETGDVFELSQNGSHSAQVILKKELDYETRNAYTITLIATDNGGLNSTTTLQVDVGDIQDTPPFFLFSVYRGALVEHSPANSSVIKVQAEDGDRGYSNPVVYSIIQGDTSLFYLDEINGLISTTQTIDRESPAAMGTNGVFKLVVQATEVNKTFPQFGDMTATVDVYVTIEDINDNSPTFNTTSPYTAFVRSDVPDGALIYFEGDGYMQVYDKDQAGPSATFSLHIEQGGQPYPVFEPSPKEAFSEANVLVRVVDASALRQLGETHLTFQVIAREVNTVERFSGEASVVLTIEQAEEQTTTTVAPESDPLTAPDIVVFVVGFLVIFNIVTSVVICLFLRRGSSVPKEGLNRQGSKYYIKKRTSDDFTNHGLHDPNTTDMVEVDPEVAVCPRVGNGEVAE